MNTFGAYQSYYHSTGYPNEPSANISWIGSIQLFLQLALGPLAGALYDRGYFRHLLYSGSIIYIVWKVMPFSHVETQKSEADLQSIHDIPRPRILADHAGSRGWDWNCYWPDLLTLCVLRVAILPETSELRVGAGHHWSFSWR
jgi:hypothetical protein